MTGELYLDPNYNWIDPGAFALIGAAAFFGGVSRLTISLTIIMMEITNDIRFLLPIMTSILVSKLAADQLTHSLYHALLGTLKKAKNRFENLSVLFHVYHDSCNYCYITCL